MHGNGNKEMNKITDARLEKARLAKHARLGKWMTTTLED